MRVRARTVRHVYCTRIYMTILSNMRLLCPYTSLSAAFCAAISGSLEARARGAANAAKADGVIIAEVVERVSGRDTRGTEEICRGSCPCWAGPKVEKSTVDATMGMLLVHVGARDEGTRLGATSG